MRYVDNSFTLATKSTIGADYLTKVIEVDDQVCTLNIWDTAGQERFQGLGNNFFRGSDAAIFVYDVSRKNTFDELKSWIDQFLIQIAQEGNYKYPMHIIGNKIDRPDRIVTREAAKEFCDKLGVEYFECSAKESVNVEKAFESIARLALSKMNPTQYNFDDTIDIDNAGDKKKDDCCWEYVKKYSFNVNFNNKELF